MLNFQKYQRQWNSVKLEYIALVLLHAFENLALIIPATYTYINAKKRHTFLEETIGTLPLEDLSMQRLEWIVALAPTLIIISIPLQLGLIWAFNKYGHPWKRFFMKFSENREKNLSKVKAVALTYVSG